MYRKYGRANGSKKVQLSEERSYSSSSPLTEYLHNEANLGGHVRSAIGSVESHLGGKVDRSEENIIIENGFIYLKSLWQDEERLVNRIKEVASGKAKKSFGKYHSDYLSEPQNGALELAMNNQISIISGPPGCGKTVTAVELIRASRNKSLKVKVMTPTGKAAARISEVILENDIFVANLSPTTIHRGLEWKVDEENLEGFPRKNATSPIDADLIIIDESSMIPLPLMAALFDAIEPGTRIVFIGDANQLPPVGPGQPFIDMIESKIIPSYFLVDVFRQAKGSKIWLACQAILNQSPYEFYKLAPKDGDEIVYNPLDSTEKIKAFFKSGIQRFIDRGMDPFIDLQLLTPVREKGEASAAALNKVAARLINPGSAPCLSLSNSGEGKAGDKIIQLKNNYIKNVFNGDQGKIKEVGNLNLILESQRRGRRRVSWSRWPEENEYAPKWPALGVEITGQHLPYNEEEASEQLALAYAITIHKCVAPDTLVETSEGIKKIEDITTEGTIATPFGPQAYLNKFRRQCGEMLEITTKKGYRIVVTPDHGMTTWDGDKHTKVLASSLKEGMWLRLKLGPTIETEQLPKLPSEPEIGNIREKIWNIPTEMSENLAEFLGLFVADGTLYSRGFRLVKRHLDVVERFSYLTKTLFGVIPIMGEHIGTPKVDINSVYLSRWLEKIDGILPNQKNIPSYILQSPLYVQASFLKGLFEDGSVLSHKRGIPAIELSNVNPSVLRTIQTMLLRFGIVSAFKQYDFGSKLPRLYIYSLSAKKFAEQIGFVSESKNKKLSKVIATDKRSRIPVSREEIKQLKFYISKFTEHNSIFTGYMSRETAMNIINKAADKTPDWLLERMEWHYESINTINKIEGESICVSVPAGQRFLQNGFDGWNSQGDQYPHVAIALPSEAWGMAGRRLLLTAVSRARKRVVIAGPPELLTKAITTDRDSSRRSGLVEKLRR
jgi:ATP-dependent exoDNAse (exonuclease V) alpha subunit/intein/homing endonuclease